MISLNYSQFNFNRNYLFYSAYCFSTIVVYHYFFFFSLDVHPSLNLPIFSSFAVYPSYPPTVFLNVSPYGLHIRRPPNFLMFFPFHFLDHSHSLIVFHPPLPTPSLFPIPLPLFRNLRSPSLSVPSLSALLPLSHLTPSLSEPP